MGQMDIFIVETILAPLPAPNFPASFLNRPVRGASPAGVFGSPAPRPPMPRPPPGARPPLSFSPVLPQNRGPPAIQPEIGSLLAEIQRLKVGHAEDLLTRDKENHYLRCQLGVAGADNLETFNKLIVNDIAEGWTSFDDLPVLKNMSSAQVEWEIRVRGYAHRLIYDPKHPPPKKDFATGRSFYSRESYFRDLLEELRNKAYGAAIPSKEYQGSPPSDSPLSVGAARNHPPNHSTKKKAPLVLICPLLLVSITF